VEGGDGVGAVWWSHVEAAGMEGPGHGCSGGCDRPQVVRRPSRFVGSGRRLRGWIEPCGREHVGCRASRLADDKFILKGDV
jgi:hypothetical protein